ncbi:MAG: ATP-dependent Clp protease proteolytic subunit [Myxococcota bacterium]
MRPASPLVLVASFVALLAAWLGLAPTASAFELGSRRLEVSSAIDTKVGMKLASDLVKLDEADEAPIYLLLTATGGTAQGVLMVADTIKSLQSPVVAVVMAPVQGAAATLPMLCDRVVMLPSATLVLTEVDYEGVAKPPEPKPDAKPDPNAKEPTKAELFLQKVRADYLEKFWAVVAKRMGEKPEKLAADIAAGGRVISAQEALQKKIAFEVVTELEANRAPQVKTELKVTTSKTKSKVVPDLDK